MEISVAIEDVMVTLANLRVQEDLSIFWFAPAARGPGSLNL